MRWQKWEAMCSVPCVVYHGTLHIASPFLGSPIYTPHFFLMKNKKKKIEKKKIERKEWKNSGKNP